jgi:hypothetical protein
LQGSGKIIRNVALDSAADLDQDDVNALVEQAIALAVKPMTPSDGGETIIKSVSAKQRPRR